MKSIRNRWQLVINVGDSVTFHHPRGGHEGGVIERIERDPTGVRVTMTNGMTCTADDVTKVHVKGVLFRDLGLSAEFKFAPLSTGDEWDSGRRYVKLTDRRYRGIDSTGEPKGQVYRVGSINARVILNDAAPTAANGPTGHEQAAPLPTLDGMAHCLK